MANNNKNFNDNGYKKSQLNSLEFDLRTAAQSGKLTLENIAEAKGMSVQEIKYKMDSLGILEKYTKRAIYTGESIINRSFCKWTG